MPRHQGGQGRGSDHKPLILDVAVRGTCPSDFSQPPPLAKRVANTASRRFKRKQKMSCADIYHRKTLPAILRPHSQPHDPKAVHSASHRLSPLFQSNLLSYSAEWLQ